jgi:hypothetical protein
VIINGEKSGLLAFRDGIRPVVPQPTEWQHIGNQIDAAFIVTWLV